MKPEPLAQLPQEATAARPPLTTALPAVPSTRGTPSPFQDAPTDPFNVVPQLAQPLVPYAASFGTFASADVTDFALAANPQTALDAARLDQLAIDLGALVAGGPDGVGETCTFHLEVPGLGRMEGQVSMRNGQANVELHATRPQVAAALRSRQQEMQKSIDQASQGDVTLFIV